MVDAKTDARVPGFAPLKQFARQCGRGKPEVCFELGLWCFHQVSPIPRLGIPHSRIRFNVAQQYLSAADVKPLGINALSRAVRNNEQFAENISAATTCDLKN